MSQGLKKVFCVRIVITEREQALWVRIVKQRGLNFCQNFYFKNQSERKIQRPQKKKKFTKFFRNSTSESEFECRSEMGFYCEGAIGLRKIQSNQQKKIFRKKNVAGIRI